MLWIKMYPHCLQLKKKIETAKTNAFICTKTSKKCFLKTNFTKSLIYEWAQYNIT